MRKTISLWSVLVLLTLVWTVSSCAETASPEKAKTAIVYFSQTGNTRNACEVLAQALPADVFEVKVVKPPAAKGELPVIEPAQIDLNSYSLVIVASPVWAANLVPAIQAFLKNSSLGGRNVAVLTTTNAAMPENFQEKHKKLVVDAGGVVTGYYQVIVMDAKKDGKSVLRSKDDIQNDAMTIAGEIRKALAQ